MSLKLKVLLDNNTYIDRYYLGEPALSFYIECEGARILFDAGYSDAFIKNAAAMGIDLSALTHIVLSHGHNDHTRGLKFLTAQFDTRKIKLIAHPGALYAKRDGNEDIGAPFDAEKAGRLFGYIPQSKVCNITPSLYFLGKIGRASSFEGKTSIGEVMRAGAWQSDFMAEDTALAYDCGESVFVITGCSHSGICNICEAAKTATGKKRIAGVIGGFHLFSVDEQLRNTVEYLKRQNIGMLYPCHCVSLEAKAAMMGALPVREVGVGMELELK